MLRKGLAWSLALVMGSFFLLAAVADVSGDWELKMTTQRGEMTSIITFEQDGENLKVKTTSRQGDEITGTGTIKGNAIEWTVTRTTQRGEFTTTYKGTVEGDKMTGTVEMRQGMSMEWTAVKK